MDAIIFTQGLSTTREGERRRDERELERLRIARERRVTETPVHAGGRALTAVLRSRHA